MTSSIDSIDFGQLVRAMGDAVIVADASGAIVVWNAAATRLFGFSEAEALGHSLDLIIPERQRSRHNEGYAKTVDTGITRYGSSLLRVPALHKDGHTLSIAFTVALLTGSQGQVGGVAAVIRDETARFNDDKALRRRLAELEQVAARSAA
ncbi:PAS domain-containing protein [Ideonella sp.]|uniref:PAS domain-containing protein n=1 Tax=Ideonella sp. TaxID=1929293 RepID=UPI002B45941B|nr:PAS domain-containing protein [Ideonella sp.]HJV71433.1 PAS domain-containing protein [Ideonella sp.]